MTHDAQQGPCVAPGSTNDCDGVNHRRSEPARYRRLCVAGGKVKAFTADQLAARLPCPACRPRPVRTCVICGMAFRAPAHVTLAPTCGGARCRLTWATVRRHIREQRLAAVAPVVVTSATAPAPVLPVADAPRPVRLPDGTEAVVVWAGDMVTGAGVRGGLLADRRSAPDPLSDMAPGCWDDEARAARRRPQAAKVRRHRRPVHVVSGPRQRRTA